MKYRKKPVVVEAIQLLTTEDSIRKVTNFIENKIRKPGYRSVGEEVMEHEFWEAYIRVVRRCGGIRIKTLESGNGTQIASFGDWVIKGVNGEFYPCKPDIFKKTYEPVAAEDVESKIDEIIEKRWYIDYDAEYWDVTNGERRFVCKSEQEAKALCERLNRGYTPADAYHIKYQRSEYNGQIEKMKKLGINVEEQFFEQCVNTLIAMAEKELPVVSEKKQ